MKRFLVVALVLLFVVFLAPATRLRAEDPAKTWSLSWDYIEACSCHLFCPCYFNAGPEGGHMCMFNNVVKVASGHVGAVKVDGCKFWISGDLGGDFSKGEMKACVITYDPAVTKEQQDAIGILIGKVYPVKWGKVEVDTAPITFELKGDESYAKLGDVAEVKLTAFKQDGKQTVIHDLKYWGAQKNSGFFMAKSTHHYKGHGYDYQYADMNGFTIHIESEGALEEKK